MATGTITVRQIRTVKNNRAAVPQTAVPPRTPEVFIPPTVPPKPQTVMHAPPPALQITPFTGNGAVNKINICIAAPTMAQAEDFLCGIYTDAVNDLGGSQILIYTKHAATLSMLTGRRQYLQHIAARPSGTVIMGGAPSEKSCAYILTVANAGMRSSEVDLVFNCCDYSMLGAFSWCDISLMLINSSLPESVLPVGSPVDYVMSGFEGDRVYYFEEGDAPPAPFIKERLRCRSGLKLGAGSTVSYAQVYGGATVTAVEGGAPVYTVSSLCRDYIPIGCARVLFNMLCGLAVKRKINQGAFALICDGLDRLLGTDGAARWGWH